jgi:outer membrane protein W
VDNILPKDTSAVQKVKNNFLNLYSACSIRDSAHYMFINKKNTNLKMATKSSHSSSSKPPSSFPKDVASMKVMTCTWYTKYQPSKANGHGWYKCSKLKELNKSYLKI